MNYTVQRAAPAVPLFFRLKYVIKKPHYAIFC